MDLIIGRHAEIERGVAAGNAELTTKDRKQAKRVAVLVARTAAAELDRFDERLSKWRGRSGPSLIR